MLRLGGGERGERRPGHAVGGAEGGDADHGDGHPLREEHAGTAADVQPTVVGGGAVDDDLPRTGRGAPGDDPPRVETGGGHPIGPGRRRPVAADAVTVGTQELRLALDEGRGRADTVDAGDGADQRLGDAALCGDAFRGDAVAAAHDRVGVAVGLGEERAEAVAHGVAEHQRAGQERHADEHRGEHAGQAPLTAPEVVEDHVAHVSLRRPSCARARAQWSGWASGRRRGRRRGTRPRRRSSPRSGRG